MWQKWIVLLSATALAGCSTQQLYEGPPKASNEVVRLKGMSNWDVSAGGYATSVCAFDGKHLDSCQPFIEFLPGFHSLVAQVTYLGVSTNTREINQDFKAGECLLAISFPERAPVIAGCNK